MLNTMRTGIVAALLGITVGCGATSPAGPTAAVVTPLLVGTAPVPRTGTVTLDAERECDRSWSGIEPQLERFIRGRQRLDRALQDDRFESPPWLVGIHRRQTSGTFTLTAPSQAGQYEFRYLIDDGWSDVARSTMVTVF